MRSQKTTPKKKQSPSTPEDIVQLLLHGATIQIVNSDSYEPVIAELKNSRRVAIMHNNKSEEKRISNLIEQLTSENTKKQTLKSPRKQAQPRNPPQKKYSQNIDRLLEEDNSTSYTGDTITRESRRELLLELRERQQQLTKSAKYQQAKKIEAEIARIDKIPLESSSHSTDQASLYDEIDAAESEKAKLDEKLQPRLDILEKKRQDSIDEITKQRDEAIQALQVKRQNAKFQPSIELLELRKKETTLAKQRRFDEAEIISKQVNDLEQEETDRFSSDRDRRYDQKEGQLNDLYQTKLEAANQYWDYRISQEPTHTTSTDLSVAYEREIIDRRIASIKMRHEKDKSPKSTAARPRSQAAKDYHEEVEQTIRDERPPDGLTDIGFTTALRRRLRDATNDKDYKTAKLLHGIIESMRKPSSTRPQHKAPSVELLKKALANARTQKTNDIAALQAKLEEIDEKMRANDQAGFDKIEKETSKPASPSKFKESSKLLNMRRQVDYLAIKHDFEEAERMLREVEDLAEAERREHEAKQTKRTQKTETTSKMNQTAMLTKSEQYWQRRLDKALQEGEGKIKMDEAEIDKIIQKLKDLGEDPEIEDDSLAQSDLSQLDDSQDAIDSNGETKPEEPLTEQGDTPRTEDESSTTVDTPDTTTPEEEPLDKPDVSEEATPQGEEPAIKPEDSPSSETKPEEPRQETEEPPEEKPTNESTQQEGATGEPAAKDETADELTQHDKTTDEPADAPVPKDETADKTSPQAETPDEPTPEEESANDPAPKTDTAGEQTPEEETSDQLVEKTPNEASSKDDQPEESTNETETPVDQSIHEQKDDLSTPTDQTPVAPTTDDTPDDSAPTKRQPDEAADVQPAESTSQEIKDESAEPLPEGDKSDEPADAKTPADDTQYDESESTDESQDAPESKPQQDDLRVFMSTMVPSKPTLATTNSPPPTSESTDD